MLLMIIFGIILLLLLIVIVSSIKIVKKTYLCAVYKWTQFDTIVEPGLHDIIP